MTSVHSQPINTISYTETEPLIKAKYHPNLIYVQDQQKIQTNHNQPKKLPFNLFLSTTQYNKMLITYGKNRNNKMPSTIDGLITTLQYVNDPIFEKQISKRQKFKQILKQTQKSDQKPSHKRHNNSQTHVKYSFSKDSSQQCIKDQHRTSKLLNSQTKKGQTIDYQTLIPKSKKYSINYKPNQRKAKDQEQRKSQSYFDKTRKAKKNSTNDRSLMNKSQTKRNADISHLLIKSLIDFTEQKKADHFNKVAMEKTKSAKEEYLRLLNHKIRSYNNMQNSRRSGQSKSRSKSKSITKNDVSLQYWDQIKDDVLNSLKNDNYSHPLKEQLRNFNLNVYDHKEIASRKPRMSGQEMDNRRLYRGIEAEKSLYQKSREKKSAENKVRQNLRSLEKERKKKITHNKKKPYRPTADLIHTAFKNLVEPSPHEKGSVYVRNASSLFTNEGIKTVKKGNKQKGRK